MNTATTDTVRAHDGDTLQNESLDPTPARSDVSRIVVVLPAYNEGLSLGALLAGIERDMREAHLEYEVVVVDDGSSDDTHLIASRASFSMPVNCVVHERNQGLAAALRTGFNEALRRARPGDVIVTMDADNTHPPGLIPKLFRMIREGHDVAIASRFRSGARVLGVPVHRHLMSVAARLLFTLVFPIRGVRDYTCGYRAYRYEVLETAMTHFGDRFVSEQGFSCMVDVLLKLRHFKPVIGEAPLVLRYDLKGGVSKMAVTRTAWQTIKLLARRRFTDK